MSKQFLGVIVAILVIFGVIFAISSNKSSNNGTKSSSSTLTQHVEGQGQSGVTLVEYGDYQCPFCQQYYATVKEVAATYDQQIHFQFRNFPITSRHPNAFAAARAAEAAALQNKFWEMHDVLYQNNDPNGQAGWVAASDPTSYFDQFATQIGLNLTQFKADFASEKVNDLVNADMAEGTKLNVQGTPTFFLDGKQVTIGNSPDGFKKVLDAEIAKKQPTTTPSTTQ
ncbi:MAG: Protein-disulfide isomerase [Candidatus Saccharibacteria bacterium]|nr:Protein-disulfide isomerase [Candidatus Saccharibacteria bacterium]